VVINQNTDLGLPEVEAMLVAETDGYTKEETEFQMEKITAIFKKNRATTVNRAESAGEAAALWTARKSAYGVAARINNNLVVEDLAVPMSKVPDMLRAIADLAETHQLRIPTVGHAGDGNLHPVVCFDGTDPDQVKRVEAASKELFEKVIEMGGTLTGEHGIGLAKAPFMSMEHDSVSMDVMRGVKRLFDPENILNPGKMGLEA
jgi:glycolate oxidase